jgi:predicted RND superfamily exporter protein
LQILNQHLHEYDARWSAPPAREQMVADLWNLYQMSSPDTAPQSLGLDGQFRSASVAVGLPRLQSQQLLQLEQEILNWFKTNAPELKVNVTGHALLFAGIGKELTQNMFVGGLLSAMVISVLIGLFLGNLKIGIISLIPNLFPAAVVYGIWGVGSGIIDIAAAGTLSISLGIVVDDTIHILKRYISYRNRGYSPDHSLHLTFEQVGSALVLTTVVLSAGMLILTFSIFGPNKTTAQLMASIISVALLFDLVMLPHLLKTLDRWLFAGVPVHQPELALSAT